MSDRVTDTLRQVAQALPGGGEERPGQQQMAMAVARAVVNQRHLVVQAGTGTGKSLAYLVPAALSGEKVVIATATKALQDQLADFDLPRVASTAGEDLSFAVLKGRSNYLCRQRVVEVGGRSSQARLPGSLGVSDDAPDQAPDDDPETITEQVRTLLAWGEVTATGDRAELPFEPRSRAWAMVSTTARECPGAFRCPSGRECFAEAARARAAEADIVIVNTHLYGAHLASGGAVLPEHRVVIFDEAHEVEDVMTDSLGVSVGPGRFRSLAQSARSLVDPGDRSAMTAVDTLAETADLLGRVLRSWSGRRVPRAELTDEGGSAESLPAGDPPLATVLSLATNRVSRLVDHLRRAERQAGDDEPDLERSRRDRTLLAAGHLAADLARLALLEDGEVAWVEDGPGAPSLRLSPIDVGPLLAEQLWGSVTAILTSATVPIGLADRLGMPSATTDELDVGSPFDYRTHAVLYVAAALPDRRSPLAEDAIHDELEALIRAAGGRTLALFTSWRAMRSAADVLSARLDLPILSQSDLPKPALVAAFRAEESASLFATLGFWQGVDVPGPTLSLVTIDRIPFPRPDDPVLQARREAAGPGAFRTVDLPRAGTLLAQGAGRLIRSSTDRGVVAVLDSRLATAQYRSALLARVPPMKRSIDRGDVVHWLAEITGTDLPPDADDPSSGKASW